MDRCPTRVLRFSKDLQTASWRSAVSLHSHTMHSREYLNRLPEYIRKIPVACLIIEREIGRLALYKNHVIDFRRVFWTPPLSAREAFRLETEQIERKLGLAPLVSLTDHDNIEAGLQLSMLQEISDVPISVEWSAPFEGTVFHLGVHNLPPSQATFWMDQLRRFTGKPSHAQLRSLLQDLNSDPSILLVLNHPYWSAEGVLPDIHRASLTTFLNEFRPLLHALEINGMRSKKENHAVIALGKEVEMPVISGGDRHGCEPNAVLNLTSARTFADFVQEIRVDRRSEVLMMPQFFETLQLRLLESAWHALSDAPGEFGRRHWMTRVFLEGADGEPRPLSLFEGTNFHKFVDRCRSIMGFLVSPRMRPALRLAFLGTEESGL